MRAETSFLHNLLGTDLRLYQTGEYTEYTSQPNAFSVGISPLLYGRNERFNFFIGAQIGSALVWNKQSLTSATLVNNDFVINVEEYPTQRDLTFGINPIVGINFSTGNEKHIWVSLK